MPLYEYKCKECNHQFDIIQKFSDDPLEVCPECNGPLKKLIHSPSISFKGGGFYVNDSKSKKTKSSPKKEKDQPKDKKVEGDHGRKNVSQSLDSSNSKDSKKISKTQK